MSMPQKYFLKNSGSSVSNLDEFARELNPEQLKVVREADGPSLVLAGAGSGKTRTITYRVAYLLKNGVNPSSILLLTFTNKAAKEMLERVSGIAKGAAKGIWGGTFHSISNRILRVYGASVGLTEKFSILDQEDSRDMLKLCMKDSDLDIKEKRTPSTAIIQNILSFSRNARIPVSEVVEMKYPKFFEFIGAIEGIERAFAKRKLESNAADFDDLLLKLLELLKGNSAIKERLSRQFKYILVDEYQDTNPIQADIIDALSSVNRNVLVVGDDAQSIYSFRAATVANILDFPRRYANAKIFRLETNYRSTPEILDLANSIILNNSNQFSKRLTATRSSFAKPTLVPAANAIEEAEFVAQRILELREEGVRLPEIAVLFRATYHSQALEFELMKKDIPYDYRGGLRFFERSHIKDALAYLKIFSNPSDEVSWMRILTLGAGIGPVIAGRLVEHLRIAQSIAAAVNLDFRDLLTIKAEKGWEEIKSILMALSGEKNKSPSAFLRVIAKSAYKDYLEAEYPDAEERIADLEQMAVFSERTRDLASFLSEVSLVDDFGVLRASSREIDEDGRVVLTTIHQAKGLEWDTVFLIHMTDANFPNRRALTEEGGLEEERRLFYVSATRAKRLLYLTYPAISGSDFLTPGAPSMFLDEINRDLLDRHEVASKYGERIIELDDDGEFKNETKKKPRSYLKDF